MENKTFDEALNLYEKHRACGEYAEARANLREAIMLCPYPAVVRHLQVEYAHYHEVHPWNLWSWAKTSLGMKPSGGTKVTLKTLR